MTHSITDIHGVYAAGISAGIKAGKKDLAYIFVPNAVATAGVFTTNAFQAACVQYDRKILKRHTIKAVIINSGNANAATGSLGLKNARRTASKAASLLRVLPSEVAVSSTGIIGVQLPIEKIEAGLETLLADPYQRLGHDTAEAIMTTDLVPKSVYKAVKIGKKMFQVAGIAKGSGMIKPNMATMLGFIVTNATVTTELLQTWLQESVDESFNRVSVDTDTSTNDMVLAFATGEHQFPLNDALAVQSFKSVLKDVCIALAKLIARDGEGATKLIEVQVTGAASRLDATAIADSIVESPLVKTAVHGADPNWGRVVMAIGKTPRVKTNPDKVDVSFGDVDVFKGGTPLAFDRAQASGELAGADVLIKVNLNLGHGRAVAWGCDLTKGYIDINTEYS